MLASHAVHVIALSYLGKVTSLATSLCLRSSLFQYAASLTFMVILPAVMMTAMNWFWMLRMKDSSAKQIHARAQCFYALNTMGIQI